MYKCIDTDMYIYFPRNQLITISNSTNNQLYSANYKFYKHQFIYDSVIYWSRDGVSSNEVASTLK